MSTTTHPFAPEGIMAFVDGELSADRAQSLSAHIDQCAECSTLATDFRGLSDQMSGWQVESVPERLTGRVTSAAGELYGRSEPVLGRAVKRRRRPAVKFPVEVASAFAVVLLRLAIAVPTLLRSRMAANEASAVGSLRTLNTAAVTYLDTYAHYPRSLESFGSSPSGIATEAAAGLIDDALARGGRKSGYLFTYRTAPAFGLNRRGGYTINADPLEPGKGGQRHFSTDQTGTIFADGVELVDPSQPEKSNKHDRGGSAEGKAVGHPADTAPMTARTAELKLVVEKLDEAREGMDRILLRHKGYVGQLSAIAESRSARTIVASLLAPPDQLDALLAVFK